MKIAIFTQPLNNNYGGNLQNFALQKVLKDMGHEPITIDRHQYIKLKTKLKLGYFKGLVLHYLKRAPRPLWKNHFVSKKKQAYIRQDISRFIDEYINKTPRVYSDNAVKDIFIQSGFDAVIVGSDQVWRPIYSPNIYTYYLDFLDDNSTIKKISYAASFGTDEWEYSYEQSLRCKKLIQKFDLVTVREKAAVKLVAERLNKKAQFVLDPTMLLNKKDYLDLINDKNLPNNKGVYTYILDGSDWKNHVVETVKATLGLPQFSNCTVNNEKIPSIEGWIKGFADADFVITDSFHGTVFSIIFNKPFISLININRGASRFETILSELGLMERLLVKFDKDHIISLLDKSMDAIEIKRLLAIMKNNSLQTLRNNL